ncbi:YfhO family protein [Enterococcus sp. HY326]|uniref:YfhO family protein n=1 Tax=Enterococcus sp. HY326 TaxID=2971265 RepID=UPI00223EB1F9|nr:YfhO family protein [Enterococcus sp. HY326]
MKRAVAVAFGKKYWLDILCSFVLPVLLIGAAYATLGIYWGSDKSILASDAFAQYANFHASFNNVLQGKESIFYSWSGSLGLNYVALMGYYLNGFFTWLVVFFDNIDMPNFIYFITLLKIGVSGISFWVYAHNTYKLKRELVLALTICYALMSYVVAYGLVVMWLDTFVYLPLIVLGINRLMDKKKPLLLFISYLLLFFSSFYMAFMAGVFSFMYYVFRLLTNWQRYKSSVGYYLITALTAGGISMITILPTILDLRSNGEALDTLTKFWNDTVGAWDLVAKNLIGMYDTSQYNSMAFVYIGLLPLIFALFYFVSKKTPLKNKILFGVFLLILIMSINIEPMNLFWHGLHSPYMFLYRFSFTISFLVIILAGYGLERFTKEELNHLTNLVLFMGGVIFVFFLLSDKKRYGEITTQSLIFTVAFLAVYLGLLIFDKSESKFSRFQKFVPMTFLVLICGEMFLNSAAIIKGVSDEWYYTNTSQYQDGHEDIQNLVDLADDRNEDFFRLENLNSITMNDSFNFGYSGVTMFSSIRNRYSSAYLNALGFRSVGTNLNINYRNNTLMADGLIGIKYNIAKGDLDKFGYESIGESGEYQLYENKYALPLGILTDEGALNENDLTNQTDILNYLAGTQGEIVSIRELTIADSKNVNLTENSDGTVDLESTDLNDTKYLSWVITLPANTQGYLSLVPTEFDFVNATVTINGEKTESGSLSDDGQYYNLGYYDEPVTLEVTAGFSSNYVQDFSLYKPDLLLVDTEKYADVLSKVQEKGVPITVEGNQATAEVTTTEEQTLLTTIPADKGWKAYIDGEEIETDSFKNAFIAIEIPEGTHEIKLVYVPHGFLIGVVIAVICFILFIVFLLWLKKRRRLTDETTD